MIPGPPPPPKLERLTEAQHDWIKFVSLLEHGQDAKRILTEKAGDDVNAMVKHAQALGLPGW